ncbi:MAG: site-specific integrase [Rhizobiaceae bacterium]
MDFAKTKGWRTGENPATWRNHLKNVLPARQKLTRGHHRAMSWKEMPELIASLRSANSVAAAALEFLILTTARTGEVLGAETNEMDFDEAVWTVPASRMKAGKEHRVPLTSRALELARKYHNLGNHLFPGQTPGKALSNMAMSNVLKRLGYTETVHGMRSTFRDWVGDQTGYPEVLAELALAHNVGDETERAYRRGDALERRRKLMLAWARFLEGEEVVVQIKEIAGRK